MKMRNIFARPRRSSVGRYPEIFPAMLEALEQRLLLSADLHGMYLVDPTVDSFEGQVIYLDFDGEENVTYNGPVTVSNIDIPPFKAVPPELAGHEESIISSALATLENIYEGTGVVFATERPIQGDYSTIYVGGTNSCFADYGSFQGVSEKIDVGNADPADNAFIFSANLAWSIADPVVYGNELGEIVAHETGHLLGYAHDKVDPDGGPLAAVAKTYYQDYGQSLTQSITVEPSSHNFEVNGIAQYKWTEWYVNGNYTGESENDYSGFWAIDPNYNYYFSSGTTKIEALVYNADWSVLHERHTWNVTVGEPDLTKSSASINKTTVNPGDSLNVNITVKNVGTSTANSGYVYYYWKKDSRSYTNTYKVGSDYYGSLAPDGTSPESFSYTVPSSASAGTYYFYCWVDATGTTNESNENNNKFYWTITVEIEPPGAPGTPDLDDADDTAGASHSDNITHQTSGLTFSWGAGSDADGYYYEWDDSTPDNSTTGLSKSVNAPSGNGWHRFYVQSWNSGGRGGTSYLDVYIDRNRPSVTNLDLRDSDDLGHSPIDNITKDTNVRFTWTGNSNGGSGIYKYWYGWTDSANDASTTNNYANVSPPTNNGTYTFYVGAEAVSGLWAYYPTYTDQLPVTWDINAPSPPTLVDPSEWEDISDNTPYLDWNSSSDSSGIWYYDVNIRAHDWPADWEQHTFEYPTYNITSSNFTVPSSESLGYKSFGWQVRATDRAGNTGSYGRNGANGDWGHFTVVEQAFDITDADVFNFYDIDSDGFAREFDFKWLSATNYGTATVTAEIWADSWEVGITDRMVASKTYTISSSATWQTISDITTDSADLDHRTWDFYIILKKDSTEVDDYGVWAIRNDDEDLNDVELELSSEDVIFEPYFADVYIDNLVDNDGDGYAREFRIYFDVNSNILGNYAVEVYDDEGVEYLKTSSTFSVDGTAADYHYVTITVDDYYPSSTRDFRDFKLLLYDNNDISSWKLKDTWTKSDDSSLGDIPLESSTEDSFSPYFYDVRITNTVDSNSNSYLSQFDIEFDVDSNVGGNYYVKLYEEIFLGTDIWLDTSSTYWVNGDASDWHIFTVVVDDYGWSKGTKDFKLELWNADKGVEVQEWGPGSERPGDNSKPLNDIRVEPSTADVTVGMKVENTYQQILQHGVDWYVDTFGGKPVIGAGVGIGGDLADLAAILGVPVTGGLSSLLSLLKVSVGNFSVTSYFDLADILNLTSDGLDGWVTVWLEGGFTALSLGFGIPGAEMVSFGIVPFQVDSLEDDPWQGVSGSLVEGQFGGVAQLYGPKFNYTEAGFDGDWWGKDIGLFNLSTSIDLVNITWNFATFEVKESVLRAATLGIGGTIIEDLLFEPLANVAGGGIVETPSGSTSFLDLMLSATTGDFTEPFIRPASSGSDDHGDDLASATPISIDTPVTGIIKSTGGSLVDLDLFLFNAPSNGLFDFAVDTPSSALDPVVTVLNSSGEKIVEDDDGGPGLDSLASLSLVSGQTYFAEVRGYNGTETGSYVLTVSVDNESPQITGLPDLSLDEDDSLNNAIDLWAYASDDETPDSGLTFSIVGNTNPDCGVSIDSNRYIDINPVSDWHGIRDVTIQVSDGSLTDTDTFRVTVNSVNDAPTAQIDNITPNPAQPPSDIINFTGTGTDSDGTVVQWEWTSDIDGLLGTTEDFTYSSQNLTVGTHQISFRVCDNEDAWSNTDTATLAIGDNSDPEISGLPDRTLDEDSSLNDAIDLWAYASDDETPDSGLTFSIVGDTNPDCGVSIDSNRYIDINPVSDWHGISDVTIQVSDGSLTDTDTFRVTVNSVNDAPTAQIDNITPNPTQPPSDIINFTGTGTDTDGTVVAWEWSSDINGILSNSEDFAKSSYEMTVGEHEISFRVRDNEGAWSSTDTAGLTINNALPTATIGGIPLDPVAPGSTVTLNLGGYDNDENGQSITAGEIFLDGVLIANPLPGGYSLSAPLDAGDYTVEYRVQDDEGSMSPPAGGTIIVVEFPWHNYNYEMAEDVNADGSVQIIDATNLISKLLLEGPHELQLPGDPLPPEGDYWDVYPDGRINVTDASRVIGRLISDRLGTGALGLTSDDQAGLGTVATILDDQAEFGGVPDENMDESFDILKVARTSDAATIPILSLWQNERLANRLEGLTATEGVSISQSRRFEASARTSWSISGTDESEDSSILSLLEPVKWQE